MSSPLSVSPRFSKLCERSYLVSVLRVAKLIAVMPSLLIGAVCFCAYCNLCAKVGICGGTIFYQPCVFNFSVNLLFAI